MPSKANTRRDPQKGKKGFSTNKGFTVIELMIAVAVVAIIASLALPSYRSIIEKRSVTSGAEQISAFISAAQMESVKRNQEVAISCSTVDGRCEAIVLADTNDDADETLRTMEFAELSSNISKITYGGADKQVVFDPVRGMLQQDDLVTKPIEIQLSSPEGEYALNVILTATGRITMCSNNSAPKTVPGYKLCVVEVGG